MRPDPSTEAARWLRQAENDLAAGEALLEKSFYAQSCFQAQQAAEKALKALRWHKEGQQARGHILSASSTSGQLQAVIAYEPSFRRFQEDAGILDLYYIPTRYPNAHPGGRAAYEAYSDSQAREATGMARQIVAHVRVTIEASG